MPRVLRIRIALGLITMLVGLAAAFIFPIVALMFLNLGFASSSAKSVNALDVFQQQMLATQQLTSVIATTQISGLFVALGGFLVAFITWIVWFVRPEDSPTAPPPLVHV